MGGSPAPSRVPTAPSPCPRACSLCNAKCGVTREARSWPKLDTEREQAWGPRCRAAHLRLRMTALAWPLLPGQLLLDSRARLPHLAGPELPSRRWCRGLGTFPRHPQPLQMQGCGPFLSGHWHRNLVGSPLSGVGYMVVKNKGWDLGQPDFEF